MLQNDRENDGDDIRKDFDCTQNEIKMFYIPIYITRSFNILKRRNMIVISIEFKKL